ncbi:Tyrosine recombinase XerC [Urinicoccus massiliensis]|uniref:Tyrosine recombinase XerC n=1 Tax=Urinicoccus massiliensis TaxID=1723382 RepID=A0A8H2M6E9_9FIRM|nr:site-specific integrase [Urinicoccus massiliensis]VFB16936.1 Tyrosine recombinase XerC [Urinicoccus massiliensis]
MRYDKLDKKQSLFLRQKELNGAAFNGLNTYRKAFLNINKIIGELDYKDQDKLEEQVLSYFESIFSRLKPSTYNTKRKYLSSFFSKMEESQTIRTNPIHSMHIKKRKETIQPRPAKTEDLKVMLSGIDLRSYVGFRDYTFIILIIDTGIRPSECVRLTNEHIDLKNLYINLTSDITKTSRPRGVPISIPVAECIQKLSIANEEYFNSNKLFLTELGDKATTTIFQRRLKYYSDSLGIKITPYQLRHYFGTQYLKNQGGNLIYLQKLMGHADIAMTKRYVQVDKEALTDNHRLATPLQNVVKRNTRVKSIFTNRKE